MSMYPQTTKGLSIKLACVCFPCATFLVDMSASLKDLAATKWGDDDVACLAHLARSKPKELLLRLKGMGFNKMGDRVRLQKQLAEHEVAPIVEISGDTPPTAASCPPPEYSAKICALLASAPSGADSAALDEWMQKYASCTPHPASSPHAARLMCCACAGGLSRTPLMLTQKCCARLFATRRAHDARRASRSCAPTR